MKWVSRCGLLTMASLGLLLSAGCGESKFEIIDLQEGTGPAAKSSPSKAASGGHEDWVIETATARKEAAASPNAAVTETTTEHVSRRHVPAEPGEARAGGCER